MTNSIQKYLVHSCFSAFLETLQVAVDLFINVLSFKAVARFMTSVLFTPDRKSVV